MSSIVDVHLFSCYEASMLMVEMLDLMPKVDMIEEVKAICSIQLDILRNMVLHRHYGSDNLENFIEHMKKVTYEIDKIKEINNVEEK